MDDNIKKFDTINASKLNSVINKRKTIFVSSSYNIYFSNLNFHIHKHVKRRKISYMLQEEELFSLYNELSPLVTYMGPT